MHQMGEGPQLLAIVPGSGHQIGEMQMGDSKNTEGPQAVGDG